MPARFAYVRVQYCVPAIIIWRSLARLQGGIFVELIIDMAVPAINIPLYIRPNVPD